MNEIAIIGNKELKKQRDLAFLHPARAEEIVRFHQSFPMYQKTPLVSLDQLARHLGVKNILVKDESHRFGLNAFKVLGGSYAIGKIVANKLGMDPEDLSYERLVSPAVKEQLGELTFVTATDGNHGRGVAWAARQLRQKCIVFMPRGTSRERIENIEKEQATVHVPDANYDACVEMAHALAEEKGYILVQDTAWDGYEEIPAWIMQGYMTLAYEMVQDMEADGTQPTHVFLQGGVGSFAAAVTGFFSNRYPGQEKPIIAVVEPNAVDCLYRSAAKRETVTVEGHYSTIMAGLACGVPNPAALDVLFDYCEYYLSVSDSLAAHGMRLLGNPVPGDAPIRSGESGAAPFGAVAKILQKDRYQPMKDLLQIREDSVLVFVSTEGDTDRENYQAVVWEGAYPSGG